MIVRSIRVVSGPLEDGQVVVGQFQCRPLGDPDARRFLARRKYLSDGSVEKLANLSESRHAA
jgi:hypothetical protein